MNGLRYFINTTFLKKKDYVFDNKWNKRNKLELMNGVVSDGYSPTKWIPVTSLDESEVAAVLKVLKQHR